MAVLDAGRDRTLLGKQLCLWAGKALGGLAANLVLLTLWVDGLGVGPAVAVFPNFVLISLASYGLANRYIFPEGVTPESLRGHAIQYAGMQAATLTGKVANYALYLVLLPRVDYRLAWVVGAVATFLLTFALNRAWWSRSTVSG